jgi:hypothetical protein
MLDWRLGVAETLRVRCRGQVAWNALSCSIGGWWAYRRGGEVDGVLNRIEYESGDELKTPATTGFSTLYWRRCFKSRGGLSVSKLVSDDRSLYVDAESLSRESTEEPLGFDMAWLCPRGRTDGLRIIWLMDRWNWPKETGAVWLSGDTIEFRRLGFVPDGGETSCEFSQCIDAVMMCWMSDLLMNGMAGSGRSFIPPGITRCILGLELVFAPFPS